MTYQGNRFFTKDIYDTEIALDVNEDVLNRIYADNIKSSDKLNIEFVFITDAKEKAEDLALQIVQEYPTYSNIKVEESDDFWKVYGITDEIEMDLNIINHWNQELWDLGYKFDCKLDGWQVGT